MRHEVFEVGLTAVGAIDLEGDERESLLKAHADVQRTALLDVGLPHQEFLVGQALLGFLYGAAADSVCDELAEEFVAGLEFFLTIPATFWHSSHIAVRRGGSSR